MKYILSVALALSLLLAPDAIASSDPGMSVEGKKALIVAKSAAFGLGGGLVIGLATQSFNRNTKNIFLGGSLGMYAGIILGVYIISSSNIKPGNRKYDRPDTYDDYTSSRDSLTKPEEDQSIGVKDTHVPMKLSLFSTNF